MPCVKLPDGRVVLVEPNWTEKLSGFTLLFEAMMLSLDQRFHCSSSAKAKPLARADN
jgi:transposase